MTSGTVPLGAGWRATAPTVPPAINREPAARAVIRPPTMRFIACHPSRDRLLIPPHPPPRARDRPWPLVSARRVGPLGRRGTVRRPPHGRQPGSRAETEDGAPPLPLPP